LALKLLRNSFIAPKNVVNSRDVGDGRAGTRSKALKRSAITPKAEARRAYCPQRASALLVGVFMARHKTGAV
jgi:hypothetical protein